VTKAKPQPSKQETEARKLHGQARAKANTGDCSAALKLRDRIYRVDPRYFERSVRNDADLTRCSNARKKQQPAREPSRDSKAPASEESAPVDAATSH
jgi:hypothetical protein